MRSGIDCVLYSVHCTEVGSQELCGPGLLLLGCQSSQLAIVSTFFVPTVAYISGHFCACSFCALGGSQKTQHHTTQVYRSVRPDKDSF